MIYIEPGGYVSLCNLDATIVVLRSSNQINRIKRFVPGIEPYHNEVERRRKASAADITDEDRAIRKARTLPTQYHNLDPDKVLDPDLADAVRLRKTPDTPALQAADRFGVDIKAGNLSAKFEKRYPLLHVNSYYGSRYDTPTLRDEVLLYVNAKWESKNQAALADTA